MNLPDFIKKNFEPGLLKEIENTCRVLTAKEGDVILDTGQSPKVIPVILKGTLKISRIDENGRELLLYYVNPSESCAMTFTCCMQHFPSEIKATAESEIEYLAVPNQVMDEWITKYQGWKNFVMLTIRNRFLEMLHTIDQLAFQKLDERLIRYLKEKSKASGSALINLSHEQIAGELATSREVISRLLKRLELDKKLLLYRNQIKLLKEL